jgi:hypothetical protein
MPVRRTERGWNGWGTRSLSPVNETVSLTLNPAPIYFFSFFSGKFVSGKTATCTAVCLPLASA